jgi:exosortase/archaeosortase family protein
MDQARRSREPDSGPLAPYASTRRVVGRFLGAFAIILAALFAFSRTDYSLLTLSPASLELNATVSAAILALLGEGTVADGNGVHGSRFALTIWNACDAAEPLQLYTAAVLASPAPALLRAIGFVTGGLLILGINQIRIVSLYLLGVHFPKAFDTMHTEVWQALFIALSGGIWLFWASWTLRRAPGAV